MDVWGAQRSSIKASFTGEKGFHGSVDQGVPEAIVAAGDGGICGVAADEADLGLAELFFVMARLRVMRWLDSEAGFSLGSGRVAANP